MSSIKSININVITKALLQIQAGDESLMYFTGLDMPKHEDGSLKAKWFIGEGWYKHNEEIGFPEPIFILSDFLTQDIKRDKAIGKRLKEIGH